VTAVIRLPPIASPAMSRAVRRLAYAAAALLAAGPAAPGEAAAPTRIALRAAVEVGPGPVRLGHVARVSGADASAVRRLRELSLGEAPRPDAPVQLERVGLARWIRARTGLGAGRVAWSGPARSEIRLAVQRLAGEAVAARAAEAVRAQLASRGLRAEIASAAAPPELRLPAGPIALEVRPLPPEAALQRRLSVWVDVLVAGRFARTVQVPVELAVYGPGVVAPHPQAPGTELEPAALLEREVEWSGRSAPPVRASAGRLRVRRPLSAGEPVTRAQVVQAPLVSRGEPATLRAVEGGVLLEARVEVLQDGNAGQLVRVKLPGGTGPIAARVTGPGTLEVSP